MVDLPGLDSGFRGKDAMDRAPLKPIVRLDTIEQQIEEYLALIQDIGVSNVKLRGLRLFSALKRQQIGSGPYPGVSLFEAANRVMTDLVLLYGVRWLLREDVFGFSQYAVEFGHESKNKFDIMAEEDGESLVGEAFNVSRSFFPGKKSSMLKKLRTEGKKATYSIIMCNADAVEDQYAPAKGRGEYHVFVAVGAGSARMIPEKVSSRVPKGEPRQG
jgi:hypothetical protein